MCGVAGVLDFAGGRVDQGELARMVATLRPRGPDGSGYHIEPGIGLGHARLSIIDLAGGSQPIHNEDRSVWTVFNGEIFNYLELRAELRARGHTFHTATDTEVIVHLYEEYGEEFVHRLNGQFAMAVWDARLRKLLLVRDRPGILPLYYTRQGDRLLFASEVKGLLPLLDAAPRLNPVALNQLFSFWAPVSPGTCFDQVFEVSPGEMVIAEQGRVRRRRYWDWTFPEDPSGYWPGSEAELARQLHDHLVDATRLRLRADVPVGAYLSGGLDSSTLTALIQHHGGVPLRTFSIRFDDQALDEAAHQELMIRHLGADHSAVHCAGSDIGDQFLQAVYRAESPMLRTAPVPMSILSALVRQQGYKVVLTGEGADEVLGGYDLFKEGKIRQFWARQPESAWRPLLLKRLYPYLDITQRQAPLYLRQFFGRGLDQRHQPWFAHMPRWATTSLCKEFFSPQWAEQIRSNDPLAELALTLPAGIRRWDPFNQSQYLEARLLMSGYLLSTQGDRMLMANSVEGRFPFLDHRLIEFANRLPPKLKMRVLKEKYLLKRAVGRYLPKAVVSRHKQPYRAPDISAFFSGAVPDFVEELTSVSTVSRYGCFDAGRVQKLMKKIRAGRTLGQKDNMAFVGILSTQAWHYHFVERFSDFKADGAEDSVLPTLIAGG